MQCSVILYMWHDVHVCIYICKYILWIEVENASGHVLILESTSRIFTRTQLYVFPNGKYVLVWLQKHLLR